MQTNTNVQRGKVSKVSAKITNALQLHSAD